ncbi:DsbE family thiol:disulfide interchange protein [Exercitatus varius]|uniref:DsbE family thiol:disulfide interchange protein n=1 Tax=Exercitatus varius TaxID=67857 RepID=A0ABT6EPK0_9PAST|nr:DsbE family thiol:disulfide interchange protein [Exercitatus varius]MDG2939851.1 DsbE family thiol:disulfide interchange protein [Exercitatus varius]MDG2943194.1 DsbE family thiol:disulfide interchange protein [Exercitatus varius]MDG2945479.1 DsbE family thiol:disulfide interchange protein [Exercitatus varius]MDG2947567.1 DsbE family thiol:disulfide interchange protein [Exercitatus varius]MDG2957153.1 DsbE family thiol:disulfide interchange protein [Exercitatus varius]
MNKKLFLPLIIFLGLVIAFVVQLQRNAQGDDPKALESALVGKPMPLRQMTDLFENKPLGSEIFQQGKPILVNVWATWCPTCYAEHQYLNELAKQNVTIIGINYKDQSDKAIKWLKNLNNPYQIVINDEKGALGLDLGVYGAPETFVLDGNGVIHYRYAGDVNEKVWTQTLKPLYDKLAGEN